MEISGALEDIARGWAIRVGDPAFADWDRLTDWLAEDSTHVVAYNAAIDDEAWADEVFATPQPRSIEVTPPVQLRPGLPRLARWGGALAASVAVMAGVGWWTLHNAGQDVMTAAGEHRTIALADGSTILLNGATHLRFDARDKRTVEMLGGEALFKIHHDAARPFVVRTGAAQLIDAGTVFNVINADELLDVAVAQGAVLYRAGARNIHLNAGSALSRASDDADPVLRATEPGAVGSWNAGFLQYDAAPLGRIAADLTRNLGTPVRAAGDLDTLRFTGTLSITGPPDAVLAKTAPLLGVRFKKDQAGWRMLPLNGTAR